ncbi:hypothetical protein D3C87_1902140 [compost metagenome]
MVGKKEEELRTLSGEELTELSVRNNETLSELQQRLAAIENRAQARREGPKIVPLPPLAAE